MSAEKNLIYIKKAIKKLGGKLETVSEPRFTYRINIGKKSLIFSIKLILRDSLATTSRLTKCKDLTTRLLEEKKIRTPKTFLINENITKVKLKSIFKMLRFPIVIKDSQGSESRGVFTGINSASEGLKIIKEHLPIHKSMLIQETAIGTEYRVLVLDKKILGVLELIPPFVIGDGKTKIGELIQKKQMHTPSKTPLDSILKKILGSQMENLGSIPIKGKKVFLRNNSCLAEGGVSIDRTEEISPALAKICQRAVRTVGLRMGGIDLLCADIKKGEKDYSILEINGKPDLYIHHKPTIGKPRDVSKEIISYIFKEGL